MSMNLLNGHLGCNLGMFSVSPSSKLQHIPLKLGVGLFTVVQGKEQSQGCACARQVLTLELPSHTESLKILYLTETKLWEDWAALSLPSSKAQLLFLIHLWELFALDSVLSNMKTATGSWFRDPGGNSTRCLRDSSFELWSQNNKQETQPPRDQLRSKFNL